MVAPVLSSLVISLKSHSCKLVPHALATRQSHTHNPINEGLLAEKGGWGGVYAFNGMQGCPMSSNPAPYDHKVVVVALPRLGHHTDTAKPPGVPGVKGYRVWVRVTLTLCK